MFSGYPHLFDLLSVLGGAARRVDAETLLEHGHAGLGLTSLDLWQTVLLLLLTSFQDLNHSLIVALHMFLLLLKIRYGTCALLHPDTNSSFTHNLSQTEGVRQRHARLPCRVS